MEILDRRRKAAALYRARFTQEEIARRLGVTQKTISIDLAAIREQDRQAAAVDISVWKERELADLEQMEKDATTQFAERKKTAWLETRLRIKKRRADILGIDAPQKHADTNADGTDKPATWERVDEALDRIEKRTREVEELTP